MLNTVDAALYLPSQDAVYFFKGPHYVKYRHGQGVIPLSGRSLRVIGVDGWRDFPPAFQAGIDAAFYYPPKEHAYFFKGDKYIKYKPGEGVVPLNGNPIRQIGVDGWTTFPASFAAGIKAAMYYPKNGYAYFFKGNEYFKYHHDTGVSPLAAGPVRRLGEDGWRGLPGDFKDGLDAALYCPDLGKLYFFRGREYARWDPQDGADPRYPRRIGLLHGKSGGWPGLSQVIAGPTVAAVTHQSAGIWVWMADASSAAALHVRMENGQEVPAEKKIVDAPAPMADGEVNPHGKVCRLELAGLTPSTQYRLEVLSGNQVLDKLSFRSAPPESGAGKVKIVLGSCSDMSNNDDVPAFEAMAKQNADFVLLCGDNCYYMNSSGNTQPDGQRPFDWESPARMLRRQLEARNHPQFATLSRKTPVYSTWDDHDFGCNNACGTDLRDGWVGRQTAARIFRSMWANPYLKPADDAAINYAFRWGPVHVFVTDARYDRDEDKQVIWGDAQTKWLVDGLVASKAPLKIVVVSGQFLLTRDDQDGHERQAPAERDAVLNRLIGNGPNVDIQGRVLFLSGDVHYSELFRLPNDQARKTLELTSSPLRRAGGSSEPAEEKQPGSRIWAARRNGFAVVTIAIDRGPAGAGQVKLEIRDDQGDLLKHQGRECVSVWNLANGDLV